MKKFNLAKLLSLVLVFTLLMGTFAVLPASAAEAPSIKFVSNNVFFGEKIHLMYAVETANAPAGAKVVVTVSDGTNTYATEEKSDATYGTVYVSKSGVAAQNIATVYTATATLMDGDTVVATATQTYSVLEYLYTRLIVNNNNETNDTVSDEQEAMYNSLIDYAAKAEAVLCADRETKIGDYAFVKVVNGEESFSGIYVAGTEIGKIVEGVNAPAWSADNYESDGKFVNTTNAKLDDVVVAGSHMVLNVAAAPVVTYVYKLVTDVSQLKAGDEIVIVANEYDTAISTTQNSNNRAKASITKNGNVIEFGSDTQLIILESGSTTGTFAFNVGNGYLYAAGGTSSKNNYMRTKNTIDASASWTIEISSDGIATIKTADSSVVKNWMRYNNSSGLFSCYSSGQADICIYVKTAE